MRRCIVHALLIVQLASCSSEPPVAEGESSATSTSESTTQTQTEGDTQTTDTTGPAEASGTDTNTDTSTDTSTGTGTDTSTDTTGLEPDLPPDPGCVSWDLAQSWDELCLDTEVLIDAEPVNYLRAPGNEFGGGIYVAGPNEHRLYYPDELIADHPGQLLNVQGTVVDSNRIWLEQWTLGVLTRQPSSLVLLDTAFQVHSVIPLASEPTALNDYFDQDLGAVVHAVAYADARLEFYTNVMGNLELLGERMLPEALDELHAPLDWDAVRLVGLSRSTSTLWTVSMPVMNMGVLDPWVFQTQLVGIHTELLGDFGPDTMLAFLDAPAGLSRYSSFDVLDHIEDDNPYVLDHTIRDLDWSLVSWTWKSLFVLSEDAFLTEVARHNDMFASFYEPTRWVPLPAGTVDFLALDDLGFLCASEQSGLVLLVPD